MDVFSYIISLGASVMMPIIFTVIGLCIGMKFGQALKSGLYVGVGFVGLGVVTALLTTNFNDPLKAICDLYHLQLTFSTWAGRLLRLLPTTQQWERSSFRSVWASMCSCC